jgi:hypothetical protein
MDVQERAVSRRCTEHLSQDVMERFVEGVATPAERRQVVRHLVSGCVPCREGLRRLMEPMLKPWVPKLGS